MLCMGATSPYEAFLFPPRSAGSRTCAIPDLFEHAQQLQWNDAITWILKATAYVSGVERRLLVKSPANSFRIPRLSALFPGAMFIRLVREPCAVFASTLKLWQSMWERYALVAPPVREILTERIMETRLALERRLQSVWPALPADRVATVHYEELVADPCHTIGLLRTAGARRSVPAVAQGERVYGTKSTMTPARLSIFSAVLAVLLVGLGVAGAHLGAIPPMIGFLSFLLGCLIALPALLFGLICLARPSVSERRGERSYAAAGIALSLLIAVPVGFTMWRWSSTPYPSIDDVTTDYDNLARVL